MISIAQNTQLSQAKKTDFKEKSLSQLTFSGDHKYFNPRFTEHYLTKNIFQSDFLNNNKTILSIRDDASLIKYFTENEILALSFKDVCIEWNQFKNLIEKKRNRGAGAYHFDGYNSNHHQI
jgi:hypothetical protein